MQGLAFEDGTQLSRPAPTAQRPAGITSCQRLPARADQPGAGSAWAWSPSGARPRKRALLDWRSEHNIVAEHILTEVKEVESV